ncbi:MAG: ATP-binding cassette domain-containing protein [Acutalibacteraceae bacterium]
MLLVKQIHKQYKTGGLVQKALDGVSLNLRKNEFVAILGPSGSGKTTLLNIIGGLDRYDSGDLIINGISTKKYKDRDWDSYRNHTIGFVFQSYNLIPHQTVLSNVELALTISGVSKSERRKRAKKALEQVGLGKQLHKKPGQMSGGQMQRVAIARALVNDPDILLADEPTGALDSETSVQVMELLKDVAKDRLVVMVTHNPELAEEYATRIVTLKDGKICSDSDPYEIGESEQASVHKNMGKASMSLLTALSLSFNNLWTKKARTLLTSFAGSIGIIGIALILALSNGVNTYIQSIEEDTLSEYPLQIQSSGINFASMMTDGPSNSVEREPGKVGVSQKISGMLSKVESNDLGSLKAYFDSGASGLEAYANAIEYSYSASPCIYRMNGEQIRQVNPDRSFSALGIGSSSNTNSFMSMMMSTDVFHQMPENTALFKSQYDVKAGHWPESYNECVIVLTAGGNISDFMLYTLGLRDSIELDDMINRFLAEETVEMPTDVRSYSYEELLGIQFKLINPSDCYVYDNEYQIWKDKTGDNEYMKNLVFMGEDITIVGVVQPAEDATATMLTSGIGYPASLTKHVMEQAAASPIVQEQLSKPNINVLTGNTFGEDNQNKFDMASLFSINEDALKKAFQFDSNALNVDISDTFSFDSSTIDLSGMLDFDDMELEMQELSEPDMSELFGKLNISVSTENMTKLAGSLMSGYQEYAANNPQADYSSLGEYFMNYLQTPEAKQRLSEEIQAIISDNKNLILSSDQLVAVMLEIMVDFQKYAAENGMTDPNEINTYLAAYLQTPEAQQKLAEGGTMILQIAGDIQIDQERLDALTNDMLLGYQEYAAANSLPDPSKMGEQFTIYLQTPEAQQLVSRGIMEIINVEDLEKQISAIFADAMQDVMSSLGEKMQDQISTAMQQIMTQLGSQMQSAMEQAMSQVGNDMENALKISPDAFKDVIQMNMDGDELKELMISLMSSEDTSYEGNLKTLGYADLNKPNQIDIYPKDFESKASILEILDEYNNRMEAAGMEEKVISYTDMVGTLMSSVTEIIDTISYVLIAFVAISLVVSSIMIGVITYISVLERKKEIGILRAIGASKGNISQVFNAETFIVGLCAGLIGIGLTLLILIPGNALIHSLAGSSDINASLPAVYAVILILLSVVLTLIGGLIPSRKAAKSDPVTALRTE